MGNGWCGPFLEPGEHPGGARAVHFEWATRQQRQHMTAPFLNVSEHTRQLTARCLAIFSKDVSRTGYHINLRWLKVALT